MMPSASNNTKLEKQVSGTPAESTSDNNNATNPMNKALVTIEHKIRNLEKRKTKLESYRAIQASGKELSADQKAAVAKYDAVTQTLEFARDLSKQMIQFSKDAEKEQKKQARKEAIVKAQTETSKIREVLIIQNIMKNLTADDIREAFLNGENGAVKLDAADLDILKKFHQDVETKRPEQIEDVPFLTAVQKAAEYLSMTIDGRPKQYGETTFENVKRIFQQIQESGFLDKAFCIQQPNLVEEVAAGADDVNAAEQPDGELDNGEVIENASVAVDDEPQQQQQDQPQQLNTSQAAYEGNSPVVNNVYVVEASDVGSVFVSQQQMQMPQQRTPPPSAGIANNQQPPPQGQQQQQQQQQPSQIPRQVVPSPVNIQQNPVAAIPQAVAAVAAPVPPHFPATTVRAVEEAYFKQHQYMQQIRPLAEVIGTGSFFFLQDSELDSPDLGSANYNNTNEVQTHGTNMFNQQSQPQPQQQQQQQQPPQPHQLQMVPPPVVQQQAASSAQQQPPQQQHPKGTQHVNLAAPIPTQTFTNQSFPPIVQPPTPLYPVAASTVATSLQSPLNCVPTDKQQMAQAVFSPAVNANPAILSVQHQMIAAAGHQPQVDQTATVVMMNRVPLAGYQQQFEGSPVSAPVQVLNQAPAVIQQQNESYIEQIDTSKDDVVLCANAEDANVSPTAEWETNDREDRHRDNSQSKIVSAGESNQWSTEMNSATLFNSGSSGGGGGNQSDSSSNANSNSRKNDWNDDNHHQTTGRHESNHWSTANHQNDNYGGGRSRHNYNRTDQRNRDGGGGRSNNGMDRGGMRGNNGGGGPNMGGGGYRSRNNYTSNQSQQNGGGGRGVYFRNNENSYYHNSQNGNSNNGSGGGGNNNAGTAGPYNKDGGGNNQRYDNSNNYRSRGGNVTNSANSRNNSNSANGNARSSMPMSGGGGGGGGGGMNGPRSGGGRTSGGGSSGTSYVNSRQQARQPQDVA